MDYIGNIFVDNGKENGNYYSILGFSPCYEMLLAIMEKRMETTIVYWSYRLAMRRSILGMNFGKLCNPKGPKYPYGQYLPKP